MEITLACDIVVAAKNSIFSLPEVKRGIVAVNGGLTRLVRFIGMFFFFISFFFFILMSIK